MVYLTLAIAVVVLAWFGYQFYIRMSGNMARRHDESLNAVVNLATLTVLGLLLAGMLAVGTGHDLLALIVGMVVLAIALGYYRNNYNRLNLPW